MTRLADLLLPADERSPAASALGVPEFVDEWVSAPYPQQVLDRGVLRDGLAWLDTRAGRAFATLDATEATMILDEIAAPGTARDPNASTFFVRLRHICLIGYYTSKEGMADLGYVGNQPARRFEGPPPEIRARLGVATEGTA